MVTWNEDTNNIDVSKGIGDLRSRLRYEQKTGVYSPYDSYSSKELTPDLEAIALTQYNLKRGLKEFSKEGSVALGKEMEQLHTLKVAKDVDSSKLTKVKNRASLRYLMFMSNT
jgi:hypothetical protein